MSSSAHNNLSSSASNKDSETNYVYKSKLMIKEHQVLVFTSFWSKKHLDFSLFIWKEILLMCLSFLTNKQMIYESF